LKIPMPISGALELVERRARGINERRKLENAERGSAVGLVFFCACSSEPRIGAHDGDYFIVWGCQQGPPPK
jgi:hypothetical protein